MQFSNPRTRPHSLAKAAPCRPDAAEDQEQGGGQERHRLCQSVRHAHAGGHADAPGKAAGVICGGFLRGLPVGVTWGGVI